MEKGSVILKISKNSRSIFKYIYNDSESIDFTSFPLLPPMYKLNKIKLCKLLLIQMGL